MALKPKRYAVATFGRVFDVTPSADALTFDELAIALTRFQLKPVLAQRETRELERLEHATEAKVGPIWKRLERIMHDDQVPLIRAVDRIEREILRDAKTDLRLWAPLLFGPGAKREDAGVVHLSALVFDFDGTLGLAAAREAFTRYVHIAHTTWSHTPERPKLRVVLPFEVPIAPADYDAVWHFGNDLAGGTADPTGRALARAWALPALRNAAQPHTSWVHGADLAALFDPVREGLAAASPVPTPPPTGVSFMRGDAGETYLDDGARASKPATTAAPAADAPAFDPWDGGAPAPARPARAPTTPASAPAPAPATFSPKPSPPISPEAPALEARVAALEARLEALERLLADYI